MRRVDCSLDEDDWVLLLAKGIAQPFQVLGRVRPHRNHLCTTGLIQNGGQKKTTFRYIVSIWSSTYVVVDAVSEVEHGVVREEGQGDVLTHG